MSKLQIGETAYSYYATMRTIAAQAIQKEVLGGLARIGLAGATDRLRCGASESLPEESDRRQKGGRRAYRFGRFTCAGLHASRRI